MLYKIYEIVRSAGPDIFYRYRDNGRDTKAEVLLEVHLERRNNQFQSIDEAYNALRDELKDEEERNRRYVVLPYIVFGETQRG
jgi:hypothetical protein